MLLLLRTATLVDAVVVTAASVIAAASVETATTSVDAFAVILLVLISRVIVI